MLLTPCFFGCSIFYFYFFYLGSWSNKTIVSLSVQHSRILLLVFFSLLFFKLFYKLLLTILIWRSCICFLYHFWPEAVIMPLQNIWYCMFLSNIWLVFCVTLLWNLVKKSFCGIFYHWRKKIILPLGMPIPPFTIVLRHSNFVKK